MVKKKESKHTVQVIAATVFAIVTVVHMFRIAQGWPLVLGTIALPMWLSWIAVFITGSLAVLLWKNS